MEAIAKAKYLRGSAQKARLVIDMIRGKNAGAALAILKYTNKRAATPIEKCLRSAIANAEFKAGEANIVVDVDELWVKECFVDRGPTKRRFRFRPAPQGRAYRERRHGCHITILLSSDEREEKGKDKEKKEAKPAATKSAKAKRGGAAAAPRAKKVAKEEVAAEPEVEEIKNQNAAAEAVVEETKNEPVAAADTTVEETKNETESTAEEKKTTNE